MNPSIFYPICDVSKAPSLEFEPFISSDLSKRWIAMTPFLAFAAQKHLDTLRLIVLVVSIVNHLTSKILQERKNIQILRISEIAEGRVTHDIRKVTKSVAYVKAEKEWKGNIVKNSWYVSGTKQFQSLPILVGFQRSGALAWFWNHARARLCRHQNREPVSPDLNSSVDLLPRSQFPQASLRVFTMAQLKDFFEMEKIITLPSLTFALTHRRKIRVFIPFHSFRAVNFAEHYPWGLVGVTSSSFPGQMLSHVHWQLRSAHARQRQQKGRIIDRIDPPGLLALQIYCPAFWHVRAWWMAEHLFKSSVNWEMLFLTAFRELVVECFHGCIIPRWQEKGEEETQGDGVSKVASQHPRQVSKENSLCSSIRIISTMMTSLLYSRRFFVFLQIEK